MKRLNTFLLMGVIALGACDNLDVPDYYAGSVDELTGANVSPILVFTHAQGIPIGTRRIVSGMVSNWGEVGREGYSLDPANPNNNNQRLRLQEQSFGSGTWDNGYSDIRNINILLKAVDAVAGVTDAQKEGLRGWAKTHMAIDYLMIINVYDKSGAVIDADVDVNAPLPAIVSKEMVFAHIVKLLDEAKVHLEKAGPAFAFNPGPGFAGFNTPVTFLKVNRGIKARVDVYMKNWSGALTSLSGSFIDVNQPMSLRASGAYSALSGDAVNPLYDPLPRTLVAHQSTLTDAQKRADGTPDLRATTKTSAITPRTTNSILVDRKWEVYKTNADHITIIKNEELILLRAEANFQLGNRAAAIADLNVVRVQSGGLEALPANYSGDLLNEILYNRRYSLLWEGGHRWLDWRRYGKLAELPRYQPNHVVFQYASLPQNECQPRNFEPAGCALPPVL